MDQVTAPYTNGGPSNTIVEVWGFLIILLMLQLFMYIIYHVASRVGKLHDS
jgi:choline-glycine betaine transporter